MKKILILAANPRGDLRLDYEIKDLKDAIKRNEKFDVEIELAVNAESIDNLLAENQPLIVHFCGHGAGKQGLVVLDEKRIEKSLSNETLANIFKSYGEGIECVLLNACYTEVQADVIAEYIPYVIGTSREILDQVAHYFSIGFYKGIAEEQPIEICYEWGHISIKKNLENAEVVTSIDEIDNKSRKLEVVNDGTVESTKEPLEIILKHNKSLESQFASNVSPELEKEFIEEGRRKRYKDNLRNILNKFGQRIINREKQIDDFELKQRGTLIDKVQDFWIKGFLKPSLYFNTATDIDKDHPSGQILRPLDNLEVIPFDIEQSYDSVKNSDITGQISDGQTLLILGEPGSGKTIALLQLAERLVAESRENSKKPIPVVFNLSSWTEKQLSLEEWLIEELRDKYQVPKAWSKPWIEREELTLLLDGLDEVKAEHRNACVRAIRELSNTHQATEMIVCSRIKDYEALAERLLLSSVICIQPLSKQQLLDFLENADDSLLSLKTVIEKDEEVAKFATTPLILNMMTWTYQGWSLKQCDEQFQIPGDRAFNLFESYIKKNLYTHNHKIDFHYKVVSYLSWLAKKMLQESKTLFLIEEIQPTWIKKNIQIAYFFGLIIVFLSITIVNSLLFDLDIYTSTFGSIISGLIFWNISDGYKIKVIDKFKWSLKKTLRLAPVSFLLSTCVGLIAEFLYGLILTYLFLEAPLKSILESFSYEFLTTRIDLKIAAVFIFNILGIMFCLIRGIVNSEIDISKKTIPNQGIFRSVRYSLSIAFLNLIIIYLATILLNNVLINLDSDFYFPIYFWTTFGFFFGYAAGGGASVIKHSILRFILYVNHKIPWNYARFLDHVSKILLMKKVGGGYVFYHRMLMEHFANMELER